MGVRGRAPLIDFCNRYDPRAQPRTTDTSHNLVSSRPLTQPMSLSRPFDRDPDVQMATHFSMRSQPRCHGPGALPEAAAPRLRHLSSQSLTKRASPQPDRLGHLLSRLVVVVRLETPAPQSTPRSRHMSSPSGTPERRRALKGRLRRSSAKRSAVRRTRGAFRRWNEPQKGSASSSTGCPQSVE